MASGALHVPEIIRLPFSAPPLHHSIFARFPHQVRQVRHCCWTTPPFCEKLLPTWARPADVASGILPDVEPWPPARRNLWVPVKGEKMRLMFQSVRGRQSRAGVSPAIPQSDRGIHSASTRGVPTMQDYPNGGLAAPKWFLHAGGPANQGKSNLIRPNQAKKILARMSHFESKTRNQKPPRQTGVNRK